MKNRLIYILISLMLVSLVGIIWIQTSWIDDAIAERERDFEVRVNEALNTVNDGIDTDEAEFFIKREFGGMDSLINQVIIAPKRNSEETIIQIDISSEDSGFQKSTYTEKVVFRDSQRQVSEQRFEFKRSDTSLKSGMTVQADMDSTRLNNEWYEQIEGRLSAIDSSLEEQEIEEVKRSRVASVVGRYTYEMLLSGNLEDRVPADELKEKISKALKKEGISGAFSYSVLDGKTKDFVKAYTSPKFDTSKVRQSFSKKLFPSDRGNRMDYTLLVQPESNSNFIWSKVRNMTVLSIVFTVLILLSFGYALYFIFKQKKVSQIKNDFINNMTHELKTPLASISLATASINHPEIIKNPDEIRRMTRLIQTEKDRINSHVERVLDTAAMDAGEFKLSMDELLCVEVLKDAVKHVEMTLQQAEGTIAFPDFSESAIEGDLFHLTNVFTNILDNSIKYRSDEKLNIQISLDSEGGNCVFRIEDNGIGMTAKQQKHAFDPFYRAETGNIHNRKGFGLGLSYVKGVVEKHGGTVSMKSKPGEGTTVIIQIPSYE